MKRSKMTIKVGISLVFVLLYSILSIFTHELFHIIFNICSGGYTRGIGYVNDSFYVYMSYPNSTSFILSIIGGSLGNIIFNLLIIIIGYKKKYKILIFGGFFSVMMDLLYWSTPLFPSYIKGDPYKLYSYFKLNSLYISIISLIFFILFLIIFIIMIYKYNKEFTNWYMVFIEHKEKKVFKKIKKR